MSEAGHKPRWDIIEKIFEKVDGNITDFIEQDEVNFLELDIAMMMLQEKLTQNKTNLYVSYLNEEQNKDTSGVYG